MLKSSNTVQDLSKDSITLTPSFIDGELNTWIPFKRNFFDKYWCSASR